MDRLYSLLLWSVTILASPYFAAKLLTTSKHRAGLRQRLGYGLTRFPDRDVPLCLWVHAVSVGEVRAVLPLLRALRERFCGARIVLSTITQTGQLVARREAIVADRVFYFPFDFVSCIERHLAAHRPSIVLIAETELWPNFARRCARAGVPVMLVNGRLSSRSFGRYQRVRWFMQRLLKRLRACAMQSTADQERILALGADPQRCHVAGNLKFDAAAREVPGADLVALRASWGLTAETPLIIAGSTHPGEEEILLEAFEEVLKSLPDARLLVAPRHVERAPEVAALVRQRGLDLRRRGESGAARVLLLDTMGELARTYAIADVAYVGGSLAPHGGQNVLEPAVYGVAAVFGPHMFNFAEICERLLAVDGAWQVQHGKELAQALLSLLTDPSRRRKMGERAQAIIAENRGAVDRHLEIIGDVLREAGLPGE